MGHRKHGHRVMAIERLARAVPLGAGAAVMAGGVVSLCFSAIGSPWLSWPLFAAAAVVWVALVAVFVTRSLTDSGRWRSEAALPSALTLVAGTAVLGTRLAEAGRPGPAQGLLVVGVALWVILLPQVFAHWSTPTLGTSFLVCVAPQALAVLAARLARGAGQRWELYAAEAVFVLGLMLYGAVVCRFDFRQVVLGEGDQWVLGGALAISTLAGSVLLDASARLGVQEGTRAALHTLTSWLGWAAVAAYLPLAAAEVIRPRLRFDTRRWATVFPLGMAALASLQMSRVFHQNALWDLGRALSWLALAAWLVVAAGSLRRARAIAARPSRPADRRAQR